MKYVSVDIETTGLDPDYCDVLEIGMVVDDTLRQEIPVEELPSCRILVSPPTDRPYYQGDPYALSMHPKLFREIADGMAPNPGKVWPPELVEDHVKDFLMRHIHTTSKMRRITAAGKNFAGFDAPFLRKLHIQFRHRVLDPGTLYFNPMTDDAIPDFAECLRRAGLEGEVRHTAVEDAQDVVRLLRVAWQVGGHTCWPGDMGK